MSEIGIVLILKQVATREAIKYSYNQLKKLLKTNKTKLSTSSSDFENSIYILANDVLNWSEKLNIIGTDSNKAIEKLYIESKYYLTPQKFQFNKEESKPALLSKVVENETRHCVIFGKPGMGKTTSMKMLTRKILVEENFLVSQFPIPIVIRLRELRETFTDKIIHEFSKVILYQFIAKLFHISIEQKNNEFYTNRDGNLLKNIIALLDNLKPIIIIDGFDEISIEIRDDIFAQIKQIAYKTRNCKIIITSRTGEFAYQLENFSYFEIAKFDDVQIKDYSTSFLGEYIGNKFFEELKLSSYYDILYNGAYLTPLMAQADPLDQKR